MTTVLVIDDEAPIRLLCRVNLEAEGMAVLEAANGPDGLELAKAGRPDAILLDVMMPGLDGWQVAELLLEDAGTSEIPIVCAPGGGGDPTPQAPPVSSPACRPPARGSDR